MSMRLPQRLRRLRASDAMRRLVAEQGLSAADFIWPLFIHDVKGTVPVAMMPGVARLDLDGMLSACEQAQHHGIPAVALFPVVAAELRTPAGEVAYDDAGLVQRAVRAAKERFPQLLLLTDVALDPYTDHGHDGLCTDNGEIVNDETVVVLVRQALSLAHAGADIIAPSDMMDGRVGAIRTALEDAGFTGTAIMSYAAKFASAFYGPFRDAIGSGDRLRGDKQTYQLNPANLDEAMREIALDIEEGADMIMVKPGMPYLDVVREAKHRFNVPLFVYQVSGEYAMLEAAIANGWLDGERAMLEALLCCKRAGCAGILTYHALRAAQALK